MSRDILNMYEKHILKPNSRKYAINAKCMECVGCTPDNIIEGYRTVIRECTAVKCPLHNFRPYV